MAIPFGKADTGLLKYTQQAESAGAIDSGLMMAQGVGTALNAFNAVQTSISESNAALEKEVNDSFNLPEGQLGKAESEFLQGQTDIHKNLFVNSKGKDITSKQQRQYATNNYNNIVAQLDDITGYLQLSRSNSTFGPGMSERDKSHSLIMNSGNYVIDKKYNTASGYDDVRLGIPKQIKPTETPEITSLKQADYNSLSDTDKLKLDTHNNSLSNWEKWNKLPDKIGDNYNPDKYQMYSANNLPIKGEWVQGKTAQLDLWNKNITNVKTGTDLSNPKSAMSYSNDIKSKLKEANPNYQGRMDMIFGDFSDDGIDNTFASTFIKGANIDKHPNLYKKSNGDPIVLSGISGKDIVYGSDEWLALNKPEQEQLLEMYLRGQNTDGNVDQEANADWMMEKYSNFMGEVTKDAFELKQKNHFELKGRYFNAQDGTKIYPTQAKAKTAKAKELVNVHVDAAFPQRLTGVGEKELVKMLERGGPIQKALDEEFNNYTDVTFAFTGDGKIVGNIKGEEYEYDFTENPAKVLNMLKQDLALATPDEAEISNLSNDPNNDDWKEILDKQYSYHPIPATFEQTGGMTFKPAE